MKKVISVFIVVLIMLFSVPSVYASDTLKLHSSYAYLYDRETSLVYIDQKSEEKIYPASMTKILTVSLALKKINNIQDKVTVTKTDLKGLAELGATTAQFYAGEQVTYEDLLYGALLPSGADACNTLARLTYGNQTQFVKAMNEYIIELGLKNTHFMNVTGLHDDKHYTTVKDMAVIVNDALKNDTFVKVFEARTYTSSQKNHTWVSSLQRGKLSQNIDISHIDGGKSGFTDEAGLTFASTMTVHGHHLILVTAKAPGQYNHNHVRDAVHVYQYMDQQYKNFIIYKKDQDIQDFWILKTFQGHYQYQAQEDISILISHTIQTEDIDIKVDAKTIRYAPIQKGILLGHIQVQYQQQVLYDYPLVLPSTIQSQGLAIVIHYLLLIGIPSIIILLIAIFVKKKKR